MVDDIRQPIQNLGQGTAGFTSLNHAAVKGGKGFGVTAERLEQTGPFGDVLGHGSNNPFHAGVVRLAVENLKKPYDGHAGPQHGSKLFGEKDQFRWPDRGQPFPEPLQAQDSLAGAFFGDIDGHQSPGRQDTGSRIRGTRRRPCR